MSRQLYVLAHDAKIDADVVAKAAPLLATIMSTELERVRFESVDHTKVYDSQVHERTRRLATRRARASCARHRFSAGSRRTTR